MRKLAVATMVTVLGQMKEFTGKLAMEKGATRSLTAATGCIKLAKFLLFGRRKTMAKWTLRSLRNSQIKSLQPCCSDPRGRIYISPCPASFLELVQHYQGPIHAFSSSASYQKPTNFFTIRRHYLTPRSRLIVGQKPQ